MEKSLFEKVFGRTENEVMNVLNELAKVFDDFYYLNNENNVTSSGDDDESYVHVKGKHYKDGELVRKYDKEYVNGMCVRDEEYSANQNGVEDKTSKESCCRCREDEKGQILRYKSQVDKLESEIKELKKQNKELNDKLTNIKKMF